MIILHTLLWRHNGHDGVSNHQPRHCWLNHLFRHRSKKTLKLRATGQQRGKCFHLMTSSWGPVYISINVCTLSGVTCFQVCVYSCAARRTWSGRLHGVANVGRSRRTSILLMRRQSSGERVSWGRGTHYCDVINSAVASQITDVSIIYLTVCSSVDQRKHQSSALLAFVRGIHRWPVNSPHKGPVMRECFHRTSSWVSPSLALQSKTWCRYKHSLNNILSPFNTFVKPSCLNTQI